MSRIEDVRSLKPLLMEKRAKLIGQLASETVPNHRVSIQSELTIVNAELKRLNVEEAAALKYVADTKNVLGLAEQQANAERAISKLPSPIKPPKHGHIAPYLSRGEFLLKNARQMLRTIEALKPERKLPHTAAFEQPLRDFIAEQHRHVNERKASRVATAAAEPEQWKETWSDAE